MASGVNFGTQQYFGFDPRTIPGCCLWLDAADARTLTTSGGGNVTQWADKSGLGANMTPRGSFGNATIQTNYQNGLSALNFSGLNQYQTPANTGVYPSDVYILVALKSLSRMDVIAIGPTSGDNFNSLTFAEYAARRWHNGSSGFSRTPAAVATSDETSTSLLLMNWSLANNNFVIRRNGTQIMSTSAYTYGPSAGAIIQIGFRHQNFDTNLAFNAYVAEVVTFNRQLLDAERQQVEGYLAWKWALQANLPSSHPFRPTPPIMRSFLPVDVSGALLWLDAADATTFTLSGSSVTAWRDKTGLNTSSSIAGAPALTTSALLNNQPVVRFNGSSDSLLYSSFSFSQPFTVFAVTVQRASTNSAFSFVLNSSSGSSAVILYRDGPNLNFWAGGANVAASPTVAYSSNLPGVYSAVFNGASSFLGFNGQGTSNQNPGTAAWSTLYLGRDWSGVWQSHDVGEVLFYTSALSTAQRQQVEGYLARKWGLGTSLQTTHPYRSVLPSTPLFSPPLLSGLTLWLDAADRTTLFQDSGGTQPITAQGQSIGLWRDKSSRGYLMTVPSGRTAPTYGPNVINTTGTNSLWSTTNFELTGNAKLTMFFVFASSVASGYNTSCGIWVGNPNGPVGGKVIGIGIAVQGLPDNYAYYVPSTFSSAELNTVQPRLVGVTTLTAAKYDGASVFGNYNGTPLAPTGALTSGGANWSALPFQTGMRYANTGGSADGFMCEVLCYNDSLPNGQVQQVEGYLAWKWGLQTSLPASHPFAKVRP